MRPPRFLLRTLLIAVAVAGVLFASMVWYEGLSRPAHELVEDTFSIISFGIFVVVMPLAVLLRMSVWLFKNVR
jgi:hypothetical protein